MKVIINAQSSGAGSSASHFVPKMRADGKSGAFLVSVLDSEGADRENLEFSKTTEDGTAINPKAFKKAFEMWFSTTEKVNYKFPSGETLEMSLYEAMVTRLEEYKKKGSRLGFEFEPRFAPSSRGPVACGNRPDTRHLLYQTITIGFDSMGKRRVFEVESTPVEGF